MRTTIYGYIEEMDFWKEPVRSQVRQHNYQIINALPNADSWPPLSREMFAICQNNQEVSGPNLEYRGRIIHFGSNLKGIELDWIEWKLKFEKFLQQLRFTEAVVNFKPEYSKIQTNQWSVDLLKYQILHDDNMPTKISSDHWMYESTWEK